MIRPVKTVLFHAPSGKYVEAFIRTLTRPMAESKIHNGWWQEACLKDEFDSPPIDRHWDWNEVAVEYDGRILKSEKVAIVAGNDRAVQGAMLMSGDPVPSGLERGKEGLFVELLFTAPRNRPALRRDGKDFLRGIGIELLTWATWFSAHLGYAGRLLLDGSPEYIAWYEKRGLQKLPRNPIVFENVSYTPMELTPAHARKLLAGWKRS
jgi:hypothetical protein